MYENVILYKSEYMTNADGHRLRFKTDKNGKYLLSTGGAIEYEKALSGGIQISDLIQDDKGRISANGRAHTFSR